MSTPTLDQPRSTEHFQAPPPARKDLRAAAPLLFAAFATVLATLGAAASLHGVVSGWAWLTQVTVVVLAIVLATNLARHLAAPRALVPGIGLLAAVFSLTFLFFSNTALLGFIPTSATYRALLHVWAMANEQMGSQVPPVQTTGVIVFSLTLWTAVVALAVDTLAFTIRAAATAGIPLSLLLLIASLFEPSGAGIGSVAVTAIGYLLVLAAARWLESGTSSGKGRRLAVELVGERGSGQTTAARKPGNSWIQGSVIIAGAVASLMVLPMAVPGFTKGMMVEGTRPSWGGVATNIDPMIALGNDLRNNSPGTVLRYYTNDTEPLYLRTSVIGNLEGSKWQPDDALLRVPVSEPLEMSPIPTMYGVARDSVTRVVTDRYRGVWLPMPGNPVVVSGLPGNWRWSPDTGTMLAGSNEPMAAQDYTTLHQIPEITAKDLVGWTNGSQDEFFGAVDPEYSRMPDDTPESLFTATSKAIAGLEDKSPFEQAAAIQEHLRSAAFTYSEKTPVEDGYDGSGMQVIEAFLEQKAGYCVHFASTMAMMARTLGIPSRIVTGYSPGSATGNSVPGSNGTTLNEFTVSSRNAHAWPELYFPGAGWVAFEPTPGRGVPPAYAPAATAPTQNLGQDPRPSNPTTRNSASAKPSSSSSAPAVAASNQPEKKDPPLWPLAVLAGILLLASVPMSIRRFQRAGRLRRISGTGIDDAGSGVATAWAELVAMGLDYSKPMRQDESAGDYARRLAGFLPDAKTELQTLAGAYERRLYAPAMPAKAGGQSLAGALSAVEQAFKSRLSAGTRVAVGLWPRSVFAPRPLEPLGYMFSK
ncbi:DUF3488 and DUF4129 domain-containing transglutaminase family protein [Paeniglutamicibacter sp. NPDC012692]|uniref:transglutaminase TgpA family protein n=1 Tax=Paeniglutamicibacter sp. NPDC012692 TaxID=3364388 RepID=UPI0036B114D4